MSKKLFFNDILGCNPSMIGSWLPQRFKTIHTFKSRDNILECKGKRMAYVKASSDIWRGHHDTKILIWFLNGFIAIYLKIASIFPNFIIILFNLFWIVNGAFFAHKNPYLRKIFTDYTKRGVRLGLRQKSRFHDSWYSYNPALK